MDRNKLSDTEKKKIIREILGENHHAAGKNFPIFSALMDNLGHVNDALSFAELLPSFSTFLSGSVASAVVSTASFAGVILFPVVQLINVINANQIGHRMYSYRCIAYTTTAWAFDRPVASGSSRVLSNISSGAIQKRQRATTEYNNVWRETSSSVLNKLNVVCEQKNIPKNHIKAIFRALGENNPDKLCAEILVHFEKDFDGVTRHIWRRNYSIRFPQ